MDTSTHAREVGEVELDLLDWKRRVFELYALVRRSADIPDAWRHWRDVRAELFRTHSQSPLPPDRREALHGASYFEYDPHMRVLAEVRPSAREMLAIGTSHPSSIEFAHFGDAVFELDGRSLSLELYWLEGYGGGLFLPFADTTSGGETYGGGRYLLDTVKGADLGTEDGRLVLDFNFAYNPSCAYDSSWLCPLAPPRNRLPVAVRAGERLA